MGKVRTQVLFDPEHYRALKREAFERGVSMSAVVREMCKARYGRGRTTVRDPEAALKLIGAFSDPRPDVSERHDEYLHGELK